jgi:hypothetical protein
VLHLLSGLGMASSVFTAGVFVWAAVGKIRHPWTSAEALEGVGLKQLAQRRFVSLALPWCEMLLGIAVLVLPDAYGRGASFVAVVASIVLFWIVLHAHLRVNDATCSCFGAKQAISRRTVVRNAAFSVIALFGAAFRPNGLGLEDVLAAIAGVVILVAVSIFAWMSAPQAVQGADPGLYVPRTLRASELIFRKADGKAIALSEHVAGDPAVVVFFRSGDENDRARSSAREWAAAMEGDVKVVLVGPDSRVNQDPDALEDAGAMGARLAGVSFYPTALLVGRNGLIATTPVDGAGEDAVDSLLEAVANAAQSQKRMMQA